MHRSRDLSKSPGCSFESLSSQQAWRYQDHPIGKDTPDFQHVIALSARVTVCSGRSPRLLTAQNATVLWPPHSGPRYCWIMGVTGLWNVVQPVARPVKLETLNKKRLAVDASIWIYQFLKAVRDKEGNALRNSHVVGFFRRICKLLFFGIKPVFVFDGGAPILKRQTVGARKARREGRREDAVRTAGKLLAVQMQRRAEEDERKRREERNRPIVDPIEEEIPDNLVYVDELQMTAQERQQKRSFKKQDAYHLPDLPTSLHEMGGPDDLRIMSPEELEEYARQFHTGEDINIYDFSKIDFNSQFFISLPATDRYNILNAARLRSRLRMGYSKDQLDTMFPDRMAFSRFQIERVKERNELTQRLMNINGMNGEDAMFNIDGGGRVAGERGKEYVLVKNDGVEGGWALGVVSNKNKGEGDRYKPIDVDMLGKEPITLPAEEDDSEEGFEDVPIEGLNRLPKRAFAAPAQDVLTKPTPSNILDRRKALYEARQQDSGVSENVPDPIDEDPDSLFLPEAPVGSKPSAEKGDIDVLFEDVPSLDADDDDDLQRAIAMSLEDKGKEKTDTRSDLSITSSYVGPPIDKPLEFNKVNAKLGRAFAHQTNARAMGSAVTGVENPGKEKEEDPIAPELSVAQKPSTTHPATSSTSSKHAGFGGPLPFEPINLGKSVFSQKKKNVVEEGGGFEPEPTRTEKKQPDLPPWFSSEVGKEDNVWQDPAGKLDQIHSASEEQNILHRARLNRHKTGEVIDLDAGKGSHEDVIEVTSSEDEADDDVVMSQSIAIDSDIRMGDVANLTRAEPPDTAIPLESFQNRYKDREAELPPTKNSFQPEPDSDEPIEWEEGDPEEQGARVGSQASVPAPGTRQTLAEESPTSSPAPEFEDVDINTTKQAETPPTTSLPGQPGAVPFPSDETFDNVLAEDEADIYSDPEDEDLMRQLAVEAEEHARFSATLNPHSHVQSAEDYEKELRQLRNQQKKDRRDADEVSQIMVNECQQLLKFFGLPYVTAPMEAEAQCAELVNLGLVDGIVTDDSDVFLFGGTRVYKNMFNQAKFVECYLASDLEKEYSLTRPKLIDIAHLLGSDYTEGLPSVGPVTALEILSEFENLEAFSEWWGTVQLGQPGSSVDTTSPFRRKFRKNAAKIFLPNGFPDKRVNEAYLHPEVDHDPSPFAWGVPDLDALRSFLMATIGWSQERTDEVLVPVVKDMNRRDTEGTQANITQFFGGAVGIGANRPSADGAFAPRRRLEKSRRMTNALGRLHARAKERTIGEGEEIAEATGQEERTIGEGQEIAETTGQESGRLTTQKDGEAYANSVGEPKKSQKSTKRKARASTKRPTQDRPSSNASAGNSGDDYDQSKKHRKSTKSRNARKKAN